MNIDHGKKKNNLLIFLKDFSSFFIIFSIFLIVLTPLVIAIILHNNPKWLPKTDPVINDSLIKASPRRILDTEEELDLHFLDGRKFRNKIVTGKWTILSINLSGCDEECAKKLFIVRNCHANQGKYANQINRVWITTSVYPIPPEIIEAHKGMIILKSDRFDLEKYFLSKMDRGNQTIKMEEFIWVIDPNGNSILRFHKDISPIKICNSIKKVIHTSSS